MFEHQFEKLVDGQLSDTHALAFLQSTTSLTPTGSMLAFAARTLRERMVPLVFAKPLLDTCGTGGDHQSTLNISTATAIVLAACGVKVAKHGNRAVSSTSGSSDVLMELGVSADLPGDQVARCIEQVNIGFCFAPRFHPRLKALAPLRRQLGIPTIFNFLGPLCNPAQVNWQVLGVGKREYLHPMAEALRILGIERAAVVHGDPGLDEVSLQGPTTLLMVENEIISERIITPDDLGLAQASVDAIRCQHAAESAEQIRRIFKNDAVPGMPWVLANVALGLLVAGRVNLLRDGVQQAAEVVRSGLVLRTLEGLQKFTAPFRTAIN